MKNHLLEMSTQTARKLMAGMAPMLKEAARTSPDLSLFTIAMSYGCMDAPEELPAGSLRGDDMYGRHITSQSLVSREQVQA